MLIKNSLQRLSRKNVHSCPWTSRSPLPGAYLKEIINKKLWLQRFFISSPIIGKNVQLFGTNYNWSPTSTGFTFADLWMQNPSTWKGFKYLQRSRNQYSTDTEGRLQHSSSMDNIQHDMWYEKKSLWKSTGIKNQDTKFIYSQKWKEKWSHSVVSDSLWPHGL